MARKQHKTLGQLVMERSPLRACNDGRGGTDYYRDDYGTGWPAVIGVRVVRPGRYPHPSGGPASYLYSQKSRSDPDEGMVGAVVNYIAEDRDDELCSQRIFVRWANGETKWYGARVAGSFRLVS